MSETVPTEQSIETSAPEKEGEPSVLIKERTTYPRDKLGALLILLVLFAVLGSFMVLFNMILFEEKINPPKTFFSATAQKQILREAPLDQPHISTNVLLSWVIEGMMSAHTFNFMNYTRLIKEAKEYFSDEGYQEYLDALNKIGLFERLVRDKLVVIGSPSEAPKILKEGVFANRYMWKIKVPMRFNYRNFSTNHEQIYNLTLLVIRVSTDQSPNGIIIYKYETQLQEEMM